MALPWLESRNVWGDERPSGSKASEAPVRLCVTFSGNGFHSKEWWAKGEGDKMELGRVLQPLTEFRSKMLFVRGLYHEEARKGNIHSSQTGNMLSGAPIASGGEIRSGTSFDQVLAQSYGKSNKVPSLVLESAPVPASIRCLPNPMVRAIRCRASCLHASSRTPRFTRTIVCSTVRTSHGVRRRPRLRSNFIHLWLSIDCSKMKHLPKTKASSMRC